MKQICNAVFARRALAVAMIAALLGGCGMAASPTPPRQYDPFKKYPLGVRSDCAYGQYDEKSDVNNLGDPAFGCAHQNNISAMLSNPNDLNIPRATGPADAARRAVVLGKYRAGEDTATQAEFKGAASLVEGE